MCKIMYRDGYGKLVEKKTLSVKDIIHIGEQQLMVVGFDGGQFGLIDTNSFIVLSDRFRSLEDLTSYVKKFKTKNSTISISLADEWTIFFI